MRWGALSRFRSKIREGQAQFFDVASNNYSFTESRSVKCLGSCVAKTRVRERLDAEAAGRSDAPTTPFPIPARVGIARTTGRPRLWRTPRARHLDRYRNRILDIG